jgi:hypothetical protein
MAPAPLRLRLGVTRGAAVPARRSEGTVEAQSGREPSKGARKLVLQLCGLPGGAGGRLLLSRSAPNQGLTSLTGDDRPCWPPTPKIARAWHGSLLSGAVPGVGRAAIGFAMSQRTESVGSFCPLCGCGLLWSHWLQCAVRQPGDRANRGIEHPARRLPLPRGPARPPACPPARCCSQGALVPVPAAGSRRRLCGAGPQQLAPVAGPPRPASQLLTASPRRRRCRL